ncbi:MAG: molecular chaperone HtpG [Bacilli bacterium]|nr:molecular chaperone HtpG [Bacilli bacterium]
MKETKEFATESKELLNLMINSIYTNSDVFLRELISNASDAIDKHKYLALTSEGKIPTNNYEIRVEPLKDQKTLIISDNGIGMSHEDLVNNLGTIAKSGSKDFMSKVKEAKEKQDINIIGQFGVGFYSVFMVADSVEVLTKKAGEEQAYLFTSNGESEYSIEEATRDESGTTITIHMKPSTDEIDYDKYLETWTIKDLVKKYSDYIRYPIKMWEKKSRKKEGADEDATDAYEEYTEESTLNSMIPLWKKNKKEVTDEEMASFYKEKFEDYEDPLTSLFVSVDGLITYNALLYIPSHAPYNLYSDNYEKGLQLYSKGIFIKDKCPELLPDYLKFVKGLVDSESFSLNISREMLQTSPVMKKIAENVEKKIVDKLKDLKKNDSEKYAKFWDAFGEHIKFGIYSSYGGKKDLLQDTLVFHTLNNEDKYVSLQEYKDAMKEDQKVIYYASGDTIESIKLLPQIEKFKKNGIDVLFLNQKIDEFTIMMMRDYDKVEFKSISDEDSAAITDEEKAKVESLTNDNKRLLDSLKEGLNGIVDDVVLSSKLVDSPVCISTKNGMSLGMEKTLNEDPTKERDVKASKVLEINPDHELFGALEAIKNDDEAVKEYASVLYDEAMLLEGYDIKDKKEFVKKLNALMLKAFK